MSGTRRHVRALGVAAAIVVAVVVIAAALALLAGTGDRAGAVSPPATTVPSAPGGDVVVDNDFIPENRNLSECVSALPKPGCGSSARGGWRQGAILGVLVVALAFITWRIVRSVRRNRPDPAGPPVQNGFGASR
jgi:MYXO-CTERM domain-containing protein